ncbi:unnamed protein product, partial [Adineta ricciae]
FVDTNLNLYVTDCFNNRVQLFQSQQLNGITVAGTGASGTISLSCPSGIVLDAEGYLFVTDCGNHRVVGSGPNGYRCLVGCSSVIGLASNQLYYPTTMYFDNHGNMIVADDWNHRIQKFLITNISSDFVTNQPNLCPSTTWYTDAITFANSSTVGTSPFTVFVTTNNTIYVANKQNSQVLIWSEGSINPNRVISTGLNTTYSVFVTPNGDIYVDNGYSNHRVDKWTFNSNTNSSNTLYCSLNLNHQVVKKWLNDNVTTSTIVAGTGVAGSSANMLTYPTGIFVDIKFNLYVADCSNNRIQMFALGQTNGTTLVGNNAPGTPTLNCPYGVILDANGYLFIVDDHNHRILGLGPYGYRCLFGCTSVPGSALNQLNYPTAISFDSYGNLYVSDSSNSRIVKLLLASNSCNLSYNQPTICSNAIWSPNGVTFASSGTIGTIPNGIFIDGINNVYVINQVNNTILKWSQWNSSASILTYINVSNPHSVFVSITGDIYVDNGYLYGRIDKYFFNTSNFITVMNVNGSCIGLFIDINNNLYCSIQNQHQVTKLLLNNGTTIPSIVVGNGSAGSTSNMLNSPQGIYVDTNLNLYISDAGNNRIQMV